MTDTLHTVEITGNPDDAATWQIKFTCHGDRDAECHQYPDCDCERWDSDHEEEQGHPLVPHDQCWMKNWFDNDCTDPYSETLIECDYTVGMSGPIKARFEEDDYVAWEFIEEAKTDA
ncbi:hypothetical protein ACFO5K_04470 [Nocardia halotolerans]|uniref:Uncharacterized protein n=1 Tax=Nocardia halotolerans TaxID=1755878 RepID=A0ABV8VBN5_9NOCA